MRIYINWLLALSAVCAVAFLCLALPAAAVVGKIGGDELLASQSEFGGFLVRRLAEGARPYHVDTSRYERFDQRTEVLSRGDWDPIVIDSEKPFEGVDTYHIEKNDSGYTRLDYAF